jgi:hypothetical protein
VAGQERRFGILFWGRRGKGDHVRTSVRYLASTSDTARGGGGIGRDAGVKIVQRVKHGMEIFLLRGCSQVIRMGEERGMRSGKKGGDA